MPSYLSGAVAALALLASGVVAQTPPRAAASVNFALPRAYAGYSQPDITQCATAGPSRATCTAPAMTAGRYLVLARASATSTGANAIQALSIALNGQPCASLKSNPFTGAKSLPPVFCQVTLLTDTPLTISADMAVQNATPDPAGPHLVVRRLPWTGVLEASGGEIAPRPAAAPPAAK